MSKYNFPVNLTPVLFVNFDFDNIIITYSNRKDNENKILTKLMTYEHLALYKIFDDFREFLNKLKIQKIDLINNLKDKVTIQDKNQIKKEETIKLTNRIFNESSLKELDSAFENIFKDNFISNSKIIDFLNRLESIHQKYQIEFSAADLKSNKIQLEKYMFPVLKFDENEKKIYIDQLSINLKYQSYEKAKSKNKVIIKSFEIEHLLHIINTFTKSLTSILDFSLYSILRDMKEKNIGMPYVIVIKILLLKILI
jgi:hypothetical protein